MGEVAVEIDPIGVVPLHSSFTVGVHCRYQPELDAIGYISQFKFIDDGKPCRFVSVDDANNEDPRTIRIATTNHLEWLSPHRPANFKRLINSNVIEGGHVGQR